MGGKPWKMKKTLSCVSVLILLASPCLGRTGEPSAQIGGSKILVIAVDGANITAVNTERGIVVVDTGSAPPPARRARRSIEERFPGKPFVYVINTHGHGDHTFGNQVFDDALIVGHESCQDWMRRTISQFEPRLPSVQPMEEFEPAFPELTFTDRMTLHLGDTTFHIRYFGVAHTNSDVLIEIPEDKALFVGDLFFARWLPGLRKREGVFYQGPWDVPRWIESLNAVLEGRQWSAIISGHGDLIPQETLVNWRNYIRDLWNGLKGAKAEGVNLKSARSRFSLSEKFAYLEKMGYEPSELQEFHRQTLELFWNLL